MADEPTAPGTAEGAGRRKRPAPTIDLTATEVKSESDAQAQAGQSSGAADSSSAADPNTEFQTNTGENRARTTGVAWAMLASGFAGGAVVAAVLVALWFADALPVRTSPAAGLNARVTQLEAQLHKLSAAPDGSNDKAVGDLSQRIGKIESALAKQPAENPTMDARLTAVENSLKSLGVALTALTHRSD
ncbi:MAG TPA: hypothetical protein VFX37_05200, partial [Pseudolabrys sp.]|nr:hypothetical protein [Pseudolabrys sp.]